MFPGGDPLQYGGDLFLFLFGMVPNIKYWLNSQHKPKLLLHDISSLNYDMTKRSATHISRFLKNQLEIKKSRTINSF